VLDSWRCEDCSILGVRGLELMIGVRGLQSIQLRGLRRIVLEKEAWS